MPYCPTTWHHHFFSFLSFLHFSIFSTILSLSRWWRCQQPKQHVIWNIKILWYLSTNSFLNFLCWFFFGTVEQSLKIKKIYWQCFIIYNHTTLFFHDMFLKKLFRILQNIFFKYKYSTSYSLQQPKQHMQIEINK